MAVLDQIARLIGVRVRCYYDNVHGQFRGPVFAGWDRHSVVRVYLLRKLQLPTISVAALILLERLLGLYAHIVVALIALGVAILGVVSISNKLAWIIILLFVFYTIAFALSFAPWTERVLETCNKRFPNLRYLNKALVGVTSYRLYRKNKAALVTFFFLSMLEVVVVTLVFYFAAEAMALKISLIQLLVAIPLTLILARIPVSVSGIGVFESIIALFFVQFGESINHAAIYGFLMRILEFFVLLPGAFLYLTEKSRIRNESGNGVLCHSQATQNEQT